MKKFTKLVLATSVAFSANAMAMQAMDDASLSETTGQDGINIGIGISKVEIAKMYIHDNDGLADGSTYGYTPLNLSDPQAPVAGTAVSKAVNGGPNSGAAGALAIDGITVTANYDALLSSRNLMDLKIDSDGSTDGAFLNIAAAVSGLEIDIGEIGVARSGADNPQGIRRGVAAGSEKAILSGLKIKTGQMAANIQLGSTPQGAMIVLDTVMQGGLTIEDLGILDNAGGGQVTLGKIQVADAASTDLAIEAKISVTTDGLEITSVKDANFAGTDIYIQGVHLGEAAPSYANVARGTSVAGSIGDVEIQGMKTFYGNKFTGYVPGSIITVSGR
ncbi:putative pilus system protein FilA [Acinetobacter pseudolwoffii]|uniref:putative pilus system protein FilA n=1 Tax=Acinetobacter pseudolwoffii TaxID=2053287 RepID=UPI002574E271|nr:DUF6160 family protein [Acinetobacter pseudolwoffii]MDM1324068.1 pilus assembly protein FilA [Acinetobacter pseudolwoffii]